MRESQKGGLQVIQVGAGMFLLFLRERITALLLIQPLQCINEQAPAVQSARSRGSMGSGYRTVRVGIRLKLCTQSR